MNTRKRIIEAACIEFSKTGYGKARIREICKNASVNLAAVNYHFGGKAKLYMAVLDYVFSETDSWVNLDVSRLRTKAECMSELQAVLSRSLVAVIVKDDLQIRKNRLLYQEIIEPSEMFDAVYSEYLKPRISYLHEIIRRLMPEGSTEDETRLVLFETIAKFAFYANNSVLVDKISGNGDFFRDNKDMIVSHIIRGVCR